MKVSELLTQGNWIKFWSARAADREILLDINDPKAACFCFAAAIQKCYPEEYMPVIIKVASFIHPDEEFSDSGALFAVVMWNDYEATWPKVANVIKELRL